MSALLLLAGCASSVYLNEDQRAAQRCYDETPPGIDRGGLLIRNRETAWLASQINANRPSSQVDIDAVVACIDRYVNEKRQRAVH